MIFRYGGHYDQLSRNILNYSSFCHVLEAAKAEIFGRELYDSLYRKAATYAFLIIKDHIFCDGNKRTGCESAFIFLFNNDIEISADVNKTKIIDFGCNTENGTLDFENITRWLKDNSKATKETGS